MVVKEEEGLFVLLPGCEGGGEEGGWRGEERRRDRGTAEERVGTDGAV